MLKKIAALLLVPVLLAGCSAAGDVETLLRAPQLSGESAALQKALNMHDGHREKTADALGISRRTLQYKLKKFGLIRR